MLKALKSNGIPGFLPAMLLLAGSLSVAPLSAEEPSAFASSDAPKTVLTQDGDFSRSSLMTPEWREGNSVSGFSLMNPNRFSMHQSYSVGISSGSFGTASAGVYLNTLSYRLADPLTLSADVGFYSPLYASPSMGASRGGGPRSAGFQNPGLGSSLIFPHVGLEYKPTEHSSISLHLFNGQDAYKAYGGSPFLSPFR